MEPDSITHYGVKGMKWGVRRSEAQLDKAANRRNARNPDYTDNQRKRDTQTYGRRGAKRINRSMNKGDSISVARGQQKKRRDRTKGRNKYVRQAGKLVGGGVAGAGGLVAANRLAKFSSTATGQALLGKVLGPQGAAQASAALNTPAAQGAVALGAAKVGHMLSGDIAVSANMRAGGYDPSRA